MKTIYDLNYETPMGDTKSMKEFEGKVLLIVNTATECGLTPQMHGLSELYEEYQKQGLEILAFPSNDFAGQEPLGDDEISSHCELKYRARFPFASKVKVKKGPDQHKVFQWLSDKKQNGKCRFAPFWNFQKYLISKNGTLIDYYIPLTKPGSSKVKKSIEKALRES
jgi:glutathione peroxidase